MKFLSLVLVLVSFEALSAPRKVYLEDNKYVTVRCPETMEMKLEGNTVQCVCPEYSEPIGKGRNMTCGASCIIKVVEITEQECDQSCWTVKYNALVLQKNYNEILYKEKIHSMESVELSLFRSEAEEVAKKYCHKTTIDYDWD